MNDETYFESVFEENGVEHYELVHLPTRWACKTPHNGNSEEGFCKLVGQLRLYLYSKKLIPAV